VETFTLKLAQVRNLVSLSGQVTGPEVDGISKQSVDRKSNRKTENFRPTYVGAI
jgi:hypothetical protein